jgi:hypothetical protein
MTTKNQYITQAKKDNPQPQFCTINGQQIELTDEEWLTSIEAWAEMRVAQDEINAQNL